MLHGATGWIDPYRDRTGDVTPLFTVRVAKEDNSYTLIQEGITLTEEQAMQIYHAYKKQNNY